MNKTLKLSIAFAATLATAGTLTGCTDAKWEKLTALGDSAEVVCYSGTRVTFYGISTGKVSSETSSDGYFLKASSIEKLKEVSGSCEITTNPDSANAHLYKEYKENRGEVFQQSHIDAMNAVLNSSSKPKTMNTSRKHNR